MSSYLEYSFRDIASLNNEEMLVEYHRLKIDIREIDQQIADLEYAKRCVLEQVPEFNEEWADQATRERWKLPIKYKVPGPVWQIHKLALNEILRINEEIDELSQSKEQCEDRIRLVRLRAIARRIWLSEPDNDAVWDPQKIIEERRKLYREYGKSGKSLVIKSKRRKRSRKSRHAKSQGKARKTPSDNKEIKPQQKLPIFQYSDLQWPEVTIAFRSKDLIRIHAREQSKIYHFAAIGFADNRKGDQPNRLWELLKGLAVYEGRIPRDNSLPPGIVKNLPKTMSDLRKRLFKLTGIKEDPFYPWSEDKEYRARFSISWLEYIDLNESSRSRHAEPDDDDSGPITDLIDSQLDTIARYGKRRQHPRAD